MSVEDDHEIRALRENIEQTRQRIATEVEAIGDRLTPEHAKEVAKEKIVEAKDRAIESVKHTAHQVAEMASDVPGRLSHAVRSNPIPTAMICVGTGWLLWQAFRPDRGRSRGPGTYVSTDAYSGAYEGLPQGYTAQYAGGYGYTEQGAEGLELPHPSTGVRSAASSAKSRMRDATSHATQKVREVAHNAKDHVAHAAGQARERVGTAMHTMRERGGAVAVRGREGAVRAWNASNDAYVSNPLAFGAGALLVGVGLGLLLPSTESENRLLGEHRQQVVDRARSAAREAKDVAVSSAREGFRAAKDSARSEVEERNLPGFPR